MIIKHTYAKHFLLTLLAVLLPACRPTPPPPAVVVRPFPTTFMLPVTLHDGGRSDPIVCGCRAPGGNFAFGAMRGRVLITEGPESRVRVADLESVATPYAMAFVGDKLIVKKTLALVAYDMSTQKRLWEKKEYRDHDKIAVFDDHRFFTNTTSLLIERIDVETKSPDFQFDQSQSQGESSARYHSYHSIAVSPDRKLLALGFPYGASVVDLETQKEKYFLRKGNSGGYQVAFSPDSRTLYVVGNGVRAWDLQTGAMTFENKGLPEDTSSIVVSPDGALIVIGESAAVNFPCHFCVLDRQLKLLHRIEAGLTNISFLAFRENSKELITASYGGDLKLWDLTPLITGLATTPQEPPQGEHQRSGR